MATTNFSGPVNSGAGFQAPITTTAELPAAADNTGVIRIVNDNGVGDDEFAVVVSNGTAWLAIATAALS